MGQYRDIPVTVEVRYVPFVLFSVDPLAVVVDKGDAESIARFDVTVTPEEGYDLPVYCEMLNMSWPQEWIGNPIPAGGGTATVLIDTSAVAVGVNEYTIRISEDMPADFGYTGEEEVVV
jgi:hypothetical protein